MNMRIILAVWVGLAAFVVNGQSEYHRDYDNKNRFSIGTRFHFNVTADLRNLPVPANLNGGYDDGFVLEDSSRNAGGKTWNWGYQKTNQIVDAGGGNRLLVLHGIESPRNGVTDKMSGDVQYGMEATYGRELLRFGDPKAPKILGVEASFGGSALFLETENTVQGRRFRTEHYYGIGNIFLPTNAPFVGSYEGPRPPNPSFPLLATNIVGTGGSVESIRAAQRAEINGSYWGFRLGPFFELPMSGPWEAQFGAGLAIVHVDATLEYIERYAVTGTGGPPPSVEDSQDTHAWLAGFYLEARVQYWFNPVIAAYLGGQYQMVDDLKLKAFAKEATLDFGSAFGLVAGLTFSF